MWLDFVRLFYRLSVFKVKKNDLSLAYRQSYAHPPGNAVTLGAFPHRSTTLALDQFEQVRVKDANLKVWFRHAKHFRG